MDYPAYYRKVEGTSYQTYYDAIAQAQGADPQATARTCNAEDAIPGEAREKLFNVAAEIKNTFHEFGAPLPPLLEGCTVVDLCCGSGRDTYLAAQLVGPAGKVIGVELEPQAVADARDNARRNGITNAEFFCGDAGQAALELQSRGLTADVVVVDPPRKGLSPDVIQALAQMSPRKIAYVSCDPATLARDVALLKEQGFRLQKAKAVDMFPRCAHVETVCLLSKLNV